MPILSSSGDRRSSIVHGSAFKLSIAGILAQKDATGKVIGRKKVYANQEIIIGRDKTCCQYVLDDPYASKRHLRIYTVVYDDDDGNDRDTLVYAEDLSANGTYWNGALIGKGNGGFLLCNDDVLRLSRNTYFTFNCLPSSSNGSAFDLTQEREMGLFRNDYVLTDRLLGAGAFGRVFMAIEQSNRCQVVCKMVDFRRLIPKPQNMFGRPEQPVAAEDVDIRVQLRKIKDLADQQKRERGLQEKLKVYFREVEILASINHPNIISIEKVYMTDNTMYMMQEIITAGDLHSYLDSKNGKLLEVEAAVIIRQLLIAVRFLHESNIVHRDIKPDNILMTSLSAGCRVVLSDFGAARRIQCRRQRMSSSIGTYEYAAPELLGIPQSQVMPERQGYTQAVDMWAIGCVSVILLTGGYAFADPSTGAYSGRLARECNLDQLRKTKEWCRMRSRAKDFIEQLLILDEDIRMTAEEALEHVWFSDDFYQIDFDDLYHRTTRYWRPRPPKLPVIDFLDSGNIKELACTQMYLEHRRKPRYRGHTPVDAPYKPFPRNMHLALWPKRDENGRLSDEVLTALEENWGSTSEPELVQQAKSQSLPTGRYSKTSKEEEDLLTNTEAGPGLVPRSVPRTLRSLMSSPGSRAAEMDSLTRKDAREARTLEMDRKKMIELGPSPRPEHFTAAHRPRLLFKRRADIGVFSQQPYERIVEGAALMRDDVSATEEVLADTTNTTTSAIMPSVPTPQTKGKLKRRLSTPTPTLKKRRRQGSIFDLAEDSDSDGDLPSRPLPPTTPHRLSTPSKNKADDLNQLYLPR